MRFLLLLGVVTALIQPLAAQASGRTMQLLAPAVLGQTAMFGVDHPASAAGNPYALLCCMPPFAGTLPWTVSGFTVRGVLRVDPANSVGAFAGVFGPGGSVAHTVSIPSHASFVGVAFDLQSIDLDPVAGVLSLADDELSIVLAEGPPASRFLAAIPAGTFPMGSFVGPLGVAPYFNQAEAQPVHSVTIRRPFWIGKYEVTQAEYMAVRNSNPSMFPGLNRPVDSVTWHDAVAYCQALTAIEQAAGRLPSGYVYRLPTEAEWEYCCRAGTTTEFHTGSTLVCGQARIGYSYHGNTSCVAGQTAPVGSYAPNAWGLHDTHGNVLEWCLDGWDGNANYPTAAVADPYEANGVYRILRGGSWNDNSGYCRSAARFGFFPWVPLNVVGFRVVCAPVVL
jgi:formylglycine-generating enzyme required for sulfatase activity